MFCPIMLYITRRSCKTYSILFSYIVVARKDYFNAIFQFFSFTSTFHIAMSLRRSKEINDFILLCNTYLIVGYLNYPFDDYADISNF